MRSGHVNKPLLRWLLPVAIVILSVFLLQAFSSANTYPIQGITPRDGLLDIRDADAANCVFNIANEWTSTRRLCIHRKISLPERQRRNRARKNPPRIPPTEPTVCGFWRSRTGITPFAVFRWIMPAACSSMVLRLRPLAGWRTMRRILYPR